MAADLLERDAALAILDEALTGAEAGAGSVVLLFGEAGIGKTSRGAAPPAGRSRRRARVLAGACDDLLAPRTLGPLHDVVRAAPGRPAHRGAAQRPATTVLAAVQDELSDPAPRPCSSSRTRTGRTKRPWTSCATSGDASPTCRRCCSSTYRDNEVGGGPLLRFLGGLSGGAGSPRLPAVAAVPGGRPRAGRAWTNPSTTSRPCTG